MKKSRYFLVPGILAASTALIMPGTLLAQPTGHNSIQNSPSLASIMKKSVGAMESRPQFLVPDAKKDPVMPVIRPARNQFRAVPVAMEKRAEDLPAGLIVSAELIEPVIFDAVVSNGIHALPAGALPEGTLIPVAGLNGIDRGLHEFVNEGVIPSHRLPEDLPLARSLIAPDIFDSVLELGLPAALLPADTVIPVHTLSGL